MPARKSLVLQLSLMQLVKLVVFAAAALACVAPMGRVWNLVGGPGATLGLVIFDVVAVPLIWAALSFVLVQPGIWRDRMILGLLLCSVSVALGTAAFILCMGVRELLAIPLSIIDRRALLRDLAGIIVPAIVLAAAFVFLVNRIAHKFGSKSLGPRA